MSFFQSLAQSFMEKMPLEVVFGLVLNVLLKQVPPHVQARLRGYVRAVDEMDIAGAMKKAEVMTKAGETGVQDWLISLAVDLMVAQMRANSQGL